MVRGVATMAVTRARSTRSRILRGLVIATIIVLSAQGWFGDFVNIFMMPANGVPPPPASLQGITHAVTSFQPALFLLWHTYQGLVLVILAVLVLALAFAWTNSRGIRGWSIVGLLSVISAAVGGYLFVRSGFGDGGNSAQMGGSFISSYASYFMVLYYTK
ncbi:MAG TPA: hypothetical protein VMV93_06840 [Chloroflexota bacterium]|nr:hypothetical protein [Chloroflexota bacterium]